ncbi:MAG: response regulator [Pseudotabrizicola sp.]|uniref:response regulator n=1 Tax=Pseudotabrizicola sp. TaxID=2939647 RepID=UPI002726CE39|nr:response regulator [Pseudotabrizicola sp.]MDO9639919.1 response regulator [Pseudotabrizicola sp.]
MTDDDGCKILVMEDDYIVALDLCAHVKSLGITVIGPAGKVRDGLELARSAQTMHGALLDVNISGQTVFPVADVLIERNIPITFVTAYDMATLPPQYRKFRQIDKPMDPAEVSQALEEMCQDRFRNLTPPTTA